LFPRLRKFARVTPAFVVVLLAGCWGLCALGRDDLLLAVLAVELPVPVFFGLALLALACTVVARSWSAGIATLACVALAVVPLGGWNVPSRAPQPAQHTVLTCNVEQWSQGGDVVGRAFSELAPDVFCLQEAVSYDDIPGDPEWTAFRAALPGYEVLRHGEIVVGTRWPVLEQQLVALPEGPDTRPLLDVTLRAPAGGRLHVLSTHLVYARYYGELPGALVKSARARRVQVQRLLDHLATLDGPVIVCGDLNTAPNSVALSLLRQRLADAWQLRGNGFGFTFSSSWPGRRIDYLLVRGVELGELQVLEQSLSDHRALRAGFRLAVSLATPGELQGPFSSPAR